VKRPAFTRTCERREFNRERKGSYNLLLAAGALEGAALAVGGIPIPHSWFNTTRTNGDEGEELT
jgi:hypothetical protein